MIKKDDRDQHQEYCDFCGLGAGGKKYGRVKNYQILKCQKCGLIWVNPLEHFHLKNKSEEYWAEDIYLANRKNQESRFKKQLELFLKKTKSRDLKILEVGSGLGFFLNVCRQANIEACGCDISKRAVDFSCQKGNKLRLGSLDNFYQDQSYDAIFAFNLMEHLTHPRDFFEQAKRIIKNRGFLVLETPIKESLFYQLAELVFFVSQGRFNYLGINPNGHIYQFSFQVFKNIASKFNFKIIYQKRFNPPFKEIFGKSVLFEVKGKFLLRLLLPLLWLFAKIIKRENRIFIILQKNGMSA